MITLGNKKITVKEAIEHLTTHKDPSSGTVKPIHAGLQHSTWSDKGLYTNMVSIKTPASGRVVFMPSLDVPFVHEDPKNPKSAAKQSEENPAEGKYKATVLFIRKEMSEAENKELDEIIALYKALEENMVKVKASPGKDNPPFQIKCLKVYEEEDLAEYVDQKGNTRRPGIYTYSNGEISPGDVHIVFTSGGLLAPSVGRAYQEEKTWKIQKFLRENMKDASGQDLVVTNKRGTARTPKGRFIGKDWENYIFPGSLVVVFATVSPYYSGGMGLQARFSMREGDKPSVVFLPSKDRGWLKGRESWTGEEPVDASSVLDESDLASLTAGFDDLDSLGI